MSDYDFDLITIGAGSGGVRASRLAASFGAKVAVVEEEREGGTCVLRGCVPKKLLVYGSHFGHDMQDGSGYGWSADSVRHDWPAMIAAKEKELDRLHGIYVGLLEGLGTRIHGRGTVIDPHTVAVGDKRLTAERILIMIGGCPSIPDVDGRNMPTSNEG